MAIVLEGNYSKKVGLPGFSSHQFSLTLKTEITDITQVAVESDRLYRLLQSGVDTSIQQVGFLPVPKNGNGNGNGTGHSHTNGNGNGQQAAKLERWNCSDKQQALIEKLIDEHRLDKADIEKLAVERFGKSVKLLNKLEASGLIEELFEKHPRSNGNGYQRQNQPSR